MMIGKRKQRKYRNKPVTYDGYKFDSEAEGYRYLTLKSLKKAGLISELEVHPEYPLQSAFRKCMSCNNIQDHVPNSRLKKDITCERCGGKTVFFDAITYIADFRVVYTDNIEEIEDVKGSMSIITDVFAMKRKMFEWIYRDKKLKIVIPGKTGNKI